MFFTFMHEWAIEWVSNFANIDTNSMKWEM